VPAELNGRYIWPRAQNWYAELFFNQTSTILSLLTEEYRTRMVQELYHDAVTNAPQWPAQYCWPEGFMRRWHYHGVTNQPHQVMVTPEIVQILAGDADNFITHVHVGRSFNTDGANPRLGDDVPRWLGETVGFWDGDALVTWTSNIQGWFTHSSWEYSSKLQTIEIFTPRSDPQGKLLGLEHEAVFYDEEALLRPIRNVRFLPRQGNFNEVPPNNLTHCNQTFFVVNGRATPLAPGTEIRYRVEDLYGRPWAAVWEEHFEQGMQRPSGEDIFDFERE
jgi:hypothetical protein